MPFGLLYNGKLGSRPINQLDLDLDRLHPSSQHTSAYVSIRIRQPTSAYVSMRRPRLGDRLLAYMLHVDGKRSSPLSYLLSLSLSLLSLSLSHSETVAFLSFDFTQNQIKVGVVTGITSSTESLCWRRRSYYAC